jgi:hypothetical protein
VSYFANSPPMVLPASGGGPSLLSNFSLVAAKAIGSNDFVLRQFDFANGGAWMDVYLNKTGATNPSITTLAVLGGDDGGSLDLAAGGTSASQLYVRALGTGSATGLLSPVTAATVASGRYAPLKDMSASPWAFRSVASLLGVDGTIPTDAFKVIGMITNGSTGVTSQCAALMYYGSTVKLRLWGASVFTEEDTGIGDDGKRHVWDCAFDGAAVQAYCDGVAVGSPLSGLQGMPTGNGWYAFGIENGAHNANYQMKWYGGAVAYPETLSAGS